MSKVKRIGVSLDSRLLAGFDKLITKKGYSDRSGAIGDLIRQELDKEQLAEPKTHAVAAVFLVYDHHSARLSQKLLEMQHSHLLKTISSMHVHVTHHDCLEVIILRGRVSEITKMADAIVSLKGVKLGRVNLIATDKDLP